MKTWQILILGVLIGLITAGVIILIASPPRGEPVKLLPAPTAHPLLVDVSGAVQQPGIYELPQNSRIQDVLDAAGGTTEKADLTVINLASVVSDGQKIIILSQQTPSTDDKSVSILPPDAPSGRMDINTATAAELDKLPGIGAAKAEAIVKYRDQHGSFSSIAQIQNVAGIGPSIFEQIKDLISVGN
jgi:competence protein ComEA